MWPIFPAWTYSTSKQGSERCDLISSCGKQTIVANIFAVGRPTITVTKTWHQLTVIAYLKLSLTCPLSGKTSGVVDGLVCPSYILSFDEKVILHYLCDQALLLYGVDCPSSRLSNRLLHFWPHGKWKCEHYKSFGDTVEVIRLLQSNKHSQISIGFKAIV